MVKAAERRGGKLPRRSVASSLGMSGGAGLTTTNNKRVFLRKPSPFEGHQLFADLPRMQWSLALSFSTKLQLYHQNYRMRVREAVSPACARWDHLETCSFPRKTASSPRNMVHRGWVGPQTVGYSSERSNGP